MERIQALSSEDCLHLLSTTSVGRIAVTRDALPVILPVNYALDGGSILIRTTDGAILRAARAGGAVVAFEVDNLDESTMTGWSVLITGTLREVTAVSAVLRAEQLPLAPWAGGDRRHFVRITPGILSGRRIPALRPDVAVLDGRLPDGSGIDVCRDVRSVDPSIACLILTSYDDDEALFHAIMAGAAGYVLKQIRGNELVDAILRVAQGQSLLDPQVTARVLERLRGSHEEDSALSGLTEQERRVLMHIADGLTNRQIGKEMFLAEKTVKNYVSSILAKLGMERRTQAAVFASKLRDKES